MAKKGGVKRYAPDRRVTWTGKITYKRSKHPFTLHRVTQILIPLFNADVHIAVDGKYRFDTNPEIWWCYDLFTQWMKQRDLMQYKIMPGIKTVKDKYGYLPKELTAFYAWFDKAVEALQIGLNLLKLIAPELEPYIELVTQINNLYAWSRSL